MSETMTKQQVGPGRRRGVFHRWPAWAPWSATLWATAYAAVALGWTFTGSGFPSDASDEVKALLGGVSANVGAPLFAAVALAAAAIGAAMTVSGAGVRAGRRRLAIGFGSVFAATLLVAIPDTRVLALVGYLPILVVVAPFDADMRASIGEVMGPEYVHQLVAIVGGFLWAAATLAYARRTAGTCVRCGRGMHRRAWATPEAAARWGRPFVYVAAVVPALYALTRWIWAAGIPLGMDREMHAEAMADGSLWSGAWLASFSLVGTALTMGLVQRWGEVFPWWIPGRRGRPVPIGLAVVPASIMAVLVTSGGLGLIRATVGGAAMPLGAQTWAAVGPAMLWPVWGVALAAGALAYYLRRRGACADCGRS